ncbi:MAG: D-aminoacyl-tRNA deacylase, partial [Candidatus Thermoplasmatota archaeon]|nr:D-aminoacyl-tRNA deacylase [Candidatus Thermoplasmatota archaeon]
VLVTLGGGHYAPRGNAMAGQDGALLGHMLANHSLPFSRMDDGRVQGRWSHAINTAIEATRAAHPDRTMVISFDRKSFRGWERRALFEHLEAIGVHVVDSAEHASMLQGA